MNEVIPLIRPVGEPPIYEQLEALAFLVRQGTALDEHSIFILLRAADVLRKMDC